MKTLLQQLALRLNLTSPGFISGENQIIATIRELTILHSQIAEFASSISDCYSFQMFLIIINIFAAFLLTMFSILKLCLELNEKIRLASTVTLAVLMLNESGFHVIMLGVVVYSCSNAMHQVIIFLLIAIYLLITFLNVLGAKSGNSYT